MNHAKALIYLRWQLWEEPFFWGYAVAVTNHQHPKITIFKGLNDCELAGYSNSFCKQKQEEAQQELNRSMAIYNRLVDCEYHYGKDNCVLVHRALNIREYQQCLLQSKPEYCDSITA
ncbi:Uncharacterised protein [Providencia stuartii]|nr:Uncharacterised protein [Providencia stuartii]